MKKFNETILKISHVIPIFTALSALFFGALIGIGQWQLALIFIALLAVLHIFIIGTLRVEDRDRLLLAGGWLVILVTHTLQKSSGISAGYILEVVIFGFVLMSLNNIWRLAFRDKVLRFLIALLVIHFLIALSSSVLGRSHSAAALWQLQYNLKWPLMFGLGALIVWTENTDQMLRKLVAWSWIFIIPFVVVEITFPSLYSHIFGINEDIHLNPLLGVGGRYRGPFSHPGVLALTCALMATGAIVQYLQGRGRSWGLIALIYVALVLASGQRQETFAMLIAIFLVFIINWRRYLSLSLLTTILLGGLFVFGSIYHDKIPMRSTLEQWGFLDNLSVLSERAILTSKGIDVASQHFPLGSGLGTYGGAGAQKFDLSLFVDLGFGKYYWFREGKFIVDTYWPCVIAETGFIGAFLVLIIYLVILVTLSRRAWRVKGTPIFGLVLIAVAAMTLLLANTPSSAVITDPRGAFLFWLLIGAAWRATAAPETDKGYGKDVVLYDISRNSSPKIYRRHLNGENR